MKKNPIKTRKYFVDRLKDGEWDWITGDIPTSTLKDAEEIAKHMLTGRYDGVTQTRVVSYKDSGDKQIHRNYSREGFIKNPVKSIKNKDKYIYIIQLSNNSVNWKAVGFFKTLKDAKITGKMYADVYPATFVRIIKNTGEIIYHEN